MFKVGIGYDVHQLAEGYKLMIGGVHVPFEKGSVGHSDGDVLIHAICDALLGAAGLGDIGQWFRDDNPELKGVNSKMFMIQVANMVKVAGYTIGNIDSTVCLQTPKIEPFIRDMQKNLASMMKVDENNISVKATTTERMGFVGTGEGISAYAVALINK